MKLTRAPYFNRLDLGPLSLFWWPDWRDAPGLFRFLRLGPLDGWWLDVGPLTFAWRYGG